MGKWTVLSGDSDLIFNETPSGTLDGSNDTFTLTNAPTPGSDLELYLNGVLQDPGTDYSISGKIITFTVPPFSDDWILATYQK